MRLTAGVGSDHHFLKEEYDAVLWTGGGRATDLRQQTGRVAPGITPWRSHRSGRAQLTHPVRQRTGWQCGRDTSAEAGRTPLTLSSRVPVTGEEASEGSAWFPPLGPPVGSALPSTGSSEVSSPASTVLWRCATPCAPLAGLGCLRPTIPCVAPVVSLPAVHVAQPRARGSCSGPHCRTWSHGDDPGSPRFLKNPCVPTPCSSTPAGPTRQALRRRQRGPRAVHDEGSHDNHSFGAQSHGLGTRCLRFAVGVASPHARLASGCWLGFAGRDSLTRRVPMKGF
jgi:hypothetical protein